MPEARPCFARGPVRCGSRRCSFRHLWAGLLEDTWLSAGPAATSNVPGAAEALSGSRCPFIRSFGRFRCSNTCRQDSRNVNRQAQVDTLMQGNLAELLRS